MQKKSALRRAIKTAYQLLPFKQPFFTAIRSLPVPTVLMRHLRFNGTIVVSIDRSHSFLIRNHSNFIENDLFWRGYGRGWEAMSLQVWSRLAPHAQTILDIGANTGVYSLAATCLSPQATVIAFEPVDRVYQRLLSNIALNGFDIQAVPLAVSDLSGSAVIYDVPADDNVYIASLEADIKAFRDDIVERTVETVRLDDFLQDRRIARVDLVKLDIEGHEAAALRGFTSYLQRCRPAILLEILSDDIGAAVWPLLEPLGYEVYGISEQGGLRRASTLGQQVGIDRNFLLCGSTLFDAAGLRDLMQ